MSVEMIITLLQQMILCDYITDVSRNLALIIFKAGGPYSKSDNRGQKHLVLLS